MQRSKNSAVFSIVLATLSNQPLVFLAILGWLVSLYFGFFRYRQYVWSRNKVRYDLFLKLDQRRSELSSKLLLLLEVGEEGKLAQARNRSLLRRYFQLLLQIDYFREAAGLDDEMVAQLQQRCTNDLRSILTGNPGLISQLTEWLSDQNEEVTFTRDLITENTLT